MKVDYEGQRYRLAFQHTQWLGTTCRVQQLTLDTKAWVTVAEGRAVMGRHEQRFDKETGRQFALVRALHEVPNKQLRRHLVDAYIQSGPGGTRPLVKDFATRRRYYDRRQDKYTGYPSLHAAACHDQFPIEIPFRTVVTATERYLMASLASPETPEKKA